MIRPSVVYVSPRWGSRGWESAVRGLTPTATLCQPLRGLGWAACGYSMVVFGLLNGCSGSRAPDPLKLQPVPTESHAKARSVAHLSLAFADLYKPLDGTANGAIFELAPLIVQERPGFENTYYSGSRPALSEQGRQNASHDVVPWRLYSMTSTALLGGVEYRQISYLWHYNRPVFKPREVSYELDFHMIRMTLDAAGYPLAYELFGGDSKLSRLFVSQSLERAAADEYGKPLPGRVSALEQSLDRAAEVLVVRVLEDGPVPMGPIVYLAGPEQTVATLICRCMPSQVQSVVNTGYYSLAQGSDPPIESIGFLPWPLFPPREAFPIDYDDPSRLERILRWPHGL